MSDVITITGNIATPPELKHTPAGLPITTFRVASTERRLDRASGEWVDGQTNWYSVSTFRAMAEHVYRSLHKGDRVLLSGRLKLRQWESGDRKGLSVEIDADAIGHDLRWGTTQYWPAKAAPGAADAAIDSWAAAGPGLARSDADGGWSIPGAGPAESQDQRRLQPAGAESDAPF